jgi:hypothetical protein
MILGPSNFVLLIADGGFGWSSVSAFRERTSDRLNFLWFVEDQCAWMWLAALVRASGGVAR